MTLLLALLIAISDPPPISVPLWPTPAIYADLPIDFDGETKQMMRDYLDRQAEETRRLHKRLGIER